MPLKRACLGVALCISVASQTQAQERITVDTFLDRLTGRTATFNHFPDGGLVGTEQFLRRDLTVWARANGTCAYGKVYERDGAVCFDYDDDPPGVVHCWIPFAQSGTLWVVTRDGRSAQEITEISDDAVSCQNAPIS